MSRYTINDKIIEALFSEGVAEGYAAIPLIVQTFFGLCEHSLDTPTETLVRLLEGLGLDSPDKVRDFLDRDAW